MYIDIQLYLQFVLLSELLLQLDNFVLQALVELFEMVHALRFVAKTFQLLGSALSTRVSLLRQRTSCRCEDEIFWIELNRLRETRK